MKFKYKVLLSQKKVIVFSTDICRFQTSGEAQYVSDIPTQGGELCAAFVVSTQVRLRHKRLLNTYIHTYFIVSSPKGLFRNNHYLQALYLTNYNTQPTVVLITTLFKLS